MSWARGIEQVDNSGQGSYLKDGRYQLAVRRIFAKDSRGTVSLIAEFQVVSSTNPEIEVGSTRGFVKKLADADKKTMGIRDFRQMIAAVLGFDPTNDTVIREQFGEDRMYQLVPGTDNPQYEALSTAFRGRVVACEVFTRPQKNNPSKTFSPHIWTPVLENGQPKVVAVAADAPPMGAPALPALSGATPPALPGVAFAAVTPPAPAAAPAPAATFPPAGWFPHPDVPGHYHNGREVVTDAQLRDRVKTFPFG